MNIERIETTITEYPQGIDGGPPGEKFIDRKLVIVPSAELVVHEEGVGTFWVTSFEWDATNPDSIWVRGRLRQKNGDDFRRNFSNLLYTIDWNLLARAGS